ncbi:hypothetical protein E2562_024650, partial [Oryza meyeriana var. granulata]
MDSAAAAGPEPEPPSVPALPGLAVEMTTGEMEAAIAGLPAKKEALREAFDVLAACSPFPLPFAWADLDSYISSLQSSIDRRFGQLRVLEAARPAPAGSAGAATSGGEKGGKQKEDSEEEEEEIEEEEVEEEEEEEEIEEVEEVEEEEIEEEEEADEEEEEVKEEVQEVDEEQQGADEEMQKSKKDDNEPSKKAIPVRLQEEEAEKERIETEEQHGDKLASQEQDIGEDEDAKGEQRVADDVTMEAKFEEQNDEDAKGEQQVADDGVLEAKSEEQNEAKVASMVQDIEEGDEKAKKASREQGNPALPSCSNHLRGACAGMDARRLLNLVCKNQRMGLWHELPTAMRHAPDAAALVLQVVQGFLLSKKIKTTKVWGNCVGLIRCISALNALLSADTLKQAKQLAKDWKEMVDRPGSSGDTLNLSSWGLLYFLISYNIVADFADGEIFSLFGTLSRKQQKKNGIQLCKGLGLVNRITGAYNTEQNNGLNKKNHSCEGSKKYCMQADLIDYLIGNGQQLDALQLTQAFNLRDKYTPFILLKGYVERAKKNALDIINIKAPRKSLNPTIKKEVDNLMVAQNVVQQQITDFDVSS